MNPFNFSFTNYKITHDDYLHESGCRVLDLLVLSDDRLFGVRLAKHRHEEFFAVTKVKSSGKEATLWHDQLEDLAGTPVLVKVKKKFYLAIVDETEFPVVTRVITFSSLYERRSYSKCNPLKQIELKKTISRKLLIGWQLSMGERILLAEKSLKQEIAEEEALLTKETKLQNKRKRQSAIQNRQPIEVVVPGQGKKTGIPVLESEWVSLRHKTPAFLMNGESNPRNSLGLPTAYFIVDKTKPTKPVQDKFVNLLEAARGFARAR